jgi:hypothetical protein
MSKTKGKFCFHFQLTRNLIEKTIFSKLHYVTKSEFRARKQFFLSYTTLRNERAALVLYVTNVEKRGKFGDSLRPPWSRSAFYISPANFINFDRASGRTWSKDQFFLDTRRYETRIYVRETNFSKLHYVTKRVRETNYSSKLHYVTNATLRARDELFLS